MYLGFGKLAGRVRWLIALLLACIAHPVVDDFIVLFLENALRHAKGCSNTIFTFVTIFHYSLDSKTQYLISTRTSDVARL
jgi:hypothetical protein